MQTTEKPSLTPPSYPGEWSLAQIQEALKRPLPNSLLKKLKDKGNAYYLPWWTANKILDLSRLTDKPYTTTTTKPQTKPSSSLCKNIKLLFYIVSNDDYEGTKRTVRQRQNYLVSVG